MGFVNSLCQTSPRLERRHRHAYHTLPDGTLTPLHVILAMIVARKGTLYATVLAPFTLLKIESVKAGKQLSLAGRHAVKSLVSISDCAFLHKSEVPGQLIVVTKPVRSLELRLALGIWRIRAKSDAFSSI